LRLVQVEARVGTHNSAGYERPLVGGKYERPLVGIMGA